MNAGSDASLVEGLAALPTARAPRTLLPNVLAAAGLADGYAKTASAIGDVLVAFNEHGISAVDLAADGDDVFERRLRMRTGRRAVPVAALPQRLETLVRRVLAGERVRVPVDLRGMSPFRASVLRKAMEIPHGEVRPYSWIAREIGTPAAVRAVGTALASNPIPLVIPCHRVVRNDGHIGMYSLGGPHSKRALLEAEGAAPAIDAAAEAHARYVGSDTTHIYCFPTCRHARRVTSGHLVRFRDDDAARGAGYRPCKICRPALTDAS